MTWDEFKAIVDAALESAGRAGDVRIWHIDIAHPRTDEEILAFVDPRLGLTIS